MKKLKTRAFIIAILLSFSLMEVSAKTGGDVPKVDIDGAEEAAGTYLGDISTVGLILTPIAAIAVLIISGLSWMGKDEDDKENKPFAKTAKRIIFVALFIEFAQVILKVLGIS